MSSTKTPLVPYPLPCRHRQRIDPPNHAPEQPLCEIALGEHQPVVAGMLDQPSAVFTNRFCKLVNNQFSIFSATPTNATEFLTLRRELPWSFALCASKMNQAKMSPIAVSVAKIFARLSSGVSVDEFTITSGARGGS